ncbi:MAG: hypothetical protein Q7J84_18550 [Sulfuricaulis sp.]|nr:hypothetical protein [Sulfuricaulis sp.]
MADVGLVMVTLGAVLSLGVGVGDGVVLGVDVGVDVTAEVGVALGVNVAVGVEVNIGVIVDADVGDGCPRGLVLDAPEESEPPPQAVHRNSIAAINAPE